MWPLVKKFAAWAVKCESRAFDLWHNVHTGANAVDLAGQFDTKNGYWYLPTRPSVIRRVLRDLPIRDHRQSVFIDFGSGKGRVLLIAAEYPFKAIIGIELRPSLHRIAANNLRTQKRLHNCSHSTELLNLDAVDFEFPDENLVLYFFNPFGSEILRIILERLQVLLERTGGDVLLVMVNSELDDLMASFPSFDLVNRSRLRTIYRREQPSPSLRA